MNIINKILGGLAVAFGSFATLFFLLFKNKKDEVDYLTKENEQQAEEIKKQQDITKALDNAQKAEIEEKKKNEKIKNDLHSGNSSTSFNAVTTLLSDN